MEIKKNESAILFEKNERMRLENAVTTVTNQLLDVEERYVFHRYKLSFASLNENNAICMYTSITDKRFLRYETIFINSTFD